MQGKSIIAILFVFIVIAGAFWIMPAHKNKAQTMQDLVNDVSLKSMQKDMQEQVKIHQQYVMNLKGMLSQLKNASVQIDKKMQMAESFGKIGDEYIKEDLLPLALNFYQMGLSIFSEDAFLNYKSGVVFARMGNYSLDQREDFYKKAYMYYQKALQIDPSYQDAHYSIALLFFVSSEQKISVGNLNDALTEINRYITNNSSNIEAYFLKGRIAYALGDKNTALQAYQPILNLSPVGSKQYNAAKLNIDKLTSIL